MQIMSSFPNQIQSFEFHQPAQIKSHRAELFNSNPINQVLATPNQGIYFTKSFVQQNGSNYQNNSQKKQLNQQIIKNYTTQQISYSQQLSARQNPQENQQSQNLLSPRQNQYRESIKKVLTPPKAFKTPQVKSNLLVSHPVLKILNLNEIKQLSLTQSQQNQYKEKEDKDQVIANLKSQINNLENDVSNLKGKVDTLVSDNLNWELKYKRIKELYINKITQSNPSKKKKGLVASSYQSKEFFFQKEVDFEQNSNASIVTQDEKANSCKQTKLQNLKSISKNDQQKEPDIITPIFTFSQQISQFKCKNINQPYKSTTNIDNDQEDVQTQNSKKPRKNLESTQNLQKKQIETEVKVNNAKPIRNTKTQRAQKEPKEKEDYLVRQLNKFQEIQQMINAQSELQKSTKLQKGQKDQEIKPQYKKNLRK